MRVFSFSKDCSLLGVPRREKPLFFSGVSLACFQKRKGWRVRENEINRAQNERKRAQRQIRKRTQKDAKKMEKGGSE